jgi:hypothetical protein
MNRAKQLLLMAQGFLVFVYWIRQCNGAVPAWRSVASDRGWVLPLFGDRGSSSWLLHSADGAYQSVPASVPGDVVTDLFRAGHIDDPYWDRNFITQQPEWMGTAPNDAEFNVRNRTWIYESDVTLPNVRSGGRNHSVNQVKRTRSYLLVFEGVKMGARVEWNGVTLGNITNQFVRTIFPLPEFPLGDNARDDDDEGAASHRVTVTFDPAIDTRGRFMACSGGWDWAPYTRAVDGHGLRVFTFGITQPVYVVETNSAWIQSVVTSIYPRERFGTPSDRGDFDVRVQVHLNWTSPSSEASGMSLRLQSSFSSDLIRVPLVAPIPIVNVSLSAENVYLWWPAGLGRQTLYAIQVTMESEFCCPTEGVCQDKSACQTIEKRIGFRTVSLITDDSSAQTSSSPGDGSGRHGMLFNVNGLSLWCRGANLIPMDQLEGRISHRSYQWAVESAVRANMNMLRVWGGGVIPPPEFYDACDENGILVYQDLMFVEEDGHGAYEDDTIRQEILHIVRRLSHHPSIVIWNGCNECTIGDIYASFVMKTVAEVDDTRAIWPSSPSAYGWESGVHTKDGKPNGRPLRIRERETGAMYCLESHGPYPRGYSASYPGVNGVPTANSNETLIPPMFRKQDVGTAFPNTFVSEFGSTVHSSFESMSQNLSPSKWSLHGGGAPDVCQQAWGNLNYCNGTNAMAERNYPADSRIAAYFGDDIALDEVGSRSFQRQLYLSMMAQTLWMKGKIEAFRSENTFGTLIWQLNEIWPTGGWGCIEYYDGQQQFGSWKALMFLLQSFLFRDVMVACGQSGLCYARNDSPLACDVDIVFEAWDLPHGTSPLRNVTKSFAVPEGRSSVWFSLPEDFLNNSDVVLISTEWSQASSSSKTLVDSISVYLWTLPKDLPLQPRIRFVVRVNFDFVSENKTVILHVQSSGLALYVLVSASTAGHFSDNAFPLRPGNARRILFHPIEDRAFDREVFLRTLRVEHLGRSSTLSIINDVASSSMIM